MQFFLALSFNTGNLYFKCVINILMIVSDLYSAIFAVPIQEFSRRFGHYVMVNLHS